LKCERSTAKNVAYKLTRTATLYKRH